MRSPCTQGRLSIFAAKINKIDRNGKAAPGALCGPCFAGHRRAFAWAEGRRMPLPLVSIKAPAWGEGAQQIAGQRSGRRAGCELCQKYGHVHAHGEAAAIMAAA
jgi:hypothetical protein